MCSSLDAIGYAELRAQFIEHQVFQDDYPGAPVRTHGSLALQVNSAANGGL